MANDVKITELDEPIEFMLSSALMCSDTRYTAVRNGKPNMHIEVDYRGYVNIGIYSRTDGDLIMSIANALKEIE